MISFSGLGLYGRLGNQLFQYAFLRTAARRLGVPFHCPPWIGDTLFCLEGEEERAAVPKDIVAEYKEPYANIGFNESALRISDGTEIFGYFQTEKYLERGQVRRWYRFAETAIAGIRARFREVDLANSVGLHVRLGDFATTHKDLYYVPPRSYYRKALRLVRRKDNVVVFSDDIPKARALLGDLGKRVIFVEGSEPHEDLYLQTQCRDFICSPSTFNWWGAWLNAHPDKIIVAPNEGPTRPGSGISNDDFWPEGWLKLRALRRGRHHGPLLAQAPLRWPRFLLERRWRKLVRLYA
jgi:hypothetical protein